jgi:hypothetical protein
MTLKVRWMKFPEGDIVKIDDVSFDPFVEDILI